MNKKLLIVENDTSLQTLLFDYFSSINFDVFLSSKGSEVITIINNQKIDIALLDIMLDDMDGWSILRMIKKSFDIPVIMLTARSEDEDKIFGLELGANDYVTKPFSIVELKLRIENVLNNKTIQKTNFQLINHTYEVQINHQIIKLTKHEFEVIKYLSEHEKEVISRERLLEACWGYLYQGDTRTVDTTIKRIRQKLDMVSCIHTVFGVGYYFEVQQ